MVPDGTDNGVASEAAHSKRTRQRELLIAALLTKPSIEAAAKEAGIGKSTACRWLNDPEFKVAFRAARREVVEATIGRLQQVSMEAVATLRAALKCKAPTVRVSAARAILEYSLRGVEIMDLEDRVVALEAQFKEEGHA